MCSQGINGEGKLRGQPANLGSPGKMAVKTEFVCVRAPAIPEDSISEDLWWNSVLPKLISKKWFTRIFWGKFPPKSWKFFRKIFHFQATNRDTSFPVVARTQALVTEWAGTVWNLQNYLWNSCKERYQTKNVVESNCHPHLRTIQKWWDNVKHCPSTHCVGILG